MTDTKREKIIKAVISRAAIIRTANGFNTDCGATVFRAFTPIGEGDLPCISIFPRAESVETAYERQNLSMETDLILTRLIGTSNPSELAEAMLADVIEAMTGTQYVIPFTIGVTAVTPGTVITGTTSGATAIVQTVTITSGSWAGDDAAGNLTVRRKVGTFVTETVNAGVLRVTGGSAVGTGHVDLVTSGHAHDLFYLSGGQTDFPDPGDTVVSTLAKFSIIYKTRFGNPYE